MPEPSSRAVQRARNSIERACSRTSRIALAFVLASYLPGIVPSSFPRKEVCTKPGSVQFLAFAHATTSALLRLSIAATRSIVSPRRGGVPASCRVTVRCSSCLCIALPGSSVRSLRAARLGVQIVSDLPVRTVEYVPFARRSDAWASTRYGI